MKQNEEHPREAGGFYAVDFKANKGAVGFSKVRSELDLEDFGIWKFTAECLIRLGATEVVPRGKGFSASFEKFQIETQVYATKTVVAMNPVAKFTLSEAVTEKNAFSIQFSYGREMSGTDMTFGPVPENSGEIETRELAKRYIFTLAGMLEKHAKFVFDQKMGQNLSSEIFHLRA